VLAANATMTSKSSSAKSRFFNGILILLSERKKEINLGLTAAQETQ
jgi:hypothetical protein